MSRRAERVRVGGRRPDRAGRLHRGGPVMKQYLLSVYQPDGDPPSPEVLGPIMAGVAAWESDLQAAGSWVFTAGLHPSSTATVVRVTDGDTLITDGPFTEGKEHVGGFTIVRLPDLDAALESARKLSTVTGLPIEVRPLQGDVQAGCPVIPPSAGRKSGRSSGRSTAELWRC